MSNLILQRLLKQVKKNLRRLPFRNEYLMLKEIKWRILFKTVDIKKLKRPL